MSIVRLLSVLLLAACQLVRAQPGVGGHTFTAITDNLYRGSNGFWHGLVYDTGAGLIVVDTINADYSTWLQAELDERFPDQQVRYVIYSHSHWDHADGGAVFRDTATFIAQEGMWRNMDGRYPHMPGNMVDRNDNGMFEPEEFTLPWDESPGVCGYTWEGVEHKDTNEDGHITTEEFWADVVKPDLVYRDSMSLRLGGKNVGIMHPGRNHGDDVSVVLFEDEDIVFSADFLGDALIQDSMHSLPSACGPFDGHPLEAWIQSYRRVEALDFERLTTAHGRPLTFDRQTVTDTREYFEYLLRQVSAAMAAGHDLEQMKSTIMLEPYEDWDQYERLREQNIEAAYRNLIQYPQQERP